MRKEILRPLPRRAEHVDWSKPQPVCEWLAWIVAGTVSGLVPLQ